MQVLTDSAASATALATGTSTINGYLGVDKYGAELDTILDLAFLYGKSTGVVTTDYLYGATPAGFSAHCNDRNNSEEITFSQIESEVNYLCGLRNDSFYADRSFREELEYNEVYYSTDINDSAIMESEKVFLPVNIENGKSDAVDLKYASAAALDFLSRNEEGFVLMIEQAYIDKYSHNNDIDNMLYRMKSLNDTVEMVTDWASDRDDTAIIVTADHECGGLYSSVESEYDSSYNGANGPLYYDWTSTNHTQTKVGIYVYGVDVNFASLSEYRTESKIRNTDVYVLMRTILNLR
jgi:alkaline phosphatase